MGTKHPELFYYGFHSLPGGAMKTVRQLLHAKSGALATVSPDATVREALELMAAREVGAILVVEGDRLVGLMSERDYARKVILKGKASHETAVSEIMTERVMYAEPDRTVPECLALMSDKRIRHLPVLDQGRLVGIVSIGDLVKATIDEQEFIIRQLENYITR
jgi:CBS domain-containing protein